MLCTILGRLYAFVAYCKYLLAKCTENISLFFSNIFALAHVLREIIINGTLMLNLLFCTIPNILRFYYILIRGRSGDRIPVGRDFPHPSRQILRPTQPPIQWVLGLSRG